jgi:GNAT superfamily N-acetyltransferase
MACQAVAIRGPLSGQGALAEDILRALPEWFGLEQALIEYARVADELPTFVAARGKEAVGFLTLRPTSADAVEVHVMAVLPGEHRRGVGRALVERAATYARAGGCALIHVKTLAPSDPDENYAGTRAFYAALGFLPLEELPQIWGAENPCLLMVRAL